MAQGSGKLSKKRIIVGGGTRTTTKQVVKKKKIALSKGRKHFRPKGAKASNVHAVAEVETSKAINRRNEKLIAAKAVSAGTNFFLSDIVDKGTKEMNDQLRQRSKKQKGVKMTDKLKNQIQKLT